jgi:hypothetical protein
MKIIPDPAGSESTTQVNEHVTFLSLNILEVSMDCYLRAVTILSLASATMNCLSTRRPQEPACRLTPSCGTTTGARDLTG